MLDLLGRLFAPLTHALGGALELLHESGAPWWLSIVALTLVVRTVLLPLTVKQVRNARSMQSLRPEMQEIKSRHKDSGEQQRALAELYREHGVNPMAGFLPLLVQMPVFITMYHVIRDHNEHLPSFAHGGLLWFTDLTSPDPYFLLPALSACLMLASFELSSRGVPAGQRRMMRLMPLVFTVFIARFPAGLFVYWVTSNAVTLAQNLGANRLMPRAAIATPESLATAAVAETVPVASVKTAPAKTVPAKSQAEKSAKRRRRKRKKRH
ncbi:YidC/Oxa1 family membrane protein insertase [Rubrobacter aplysinae]|uniref:YidC/Oxa1 family membrane protein insertase n=1 Tax=Rubrobacter aplysinae TaxID=909625 RepID=UPI00069DA7BB|nr:membrane protein insertase YidC [Rubrobacter aplysinae]